ncbi:MAG: porin [Rhodocyclaceae bacterium]|nr:porin [Rhodocyclaceae bacterium]
MLQTKPLAAALAALSLCTLAVPLAHGADDLAQIRAQMQQLIDANARLAAEVADLQARLGKLDAAPAAPAQAAGAASEAKFMTAGDEEGTFKLPGSNTSIGVYGYVQLDAYKDLKGRQAGDWAADIGSQPVAGDDRRSGKTNFTARTSRLGVRTITPTSYGLLRTKLEADFNKGSDGDMAISNSYGFRLRHAYGEIDGDWGTLLAGQTWSTFMNLDAMPETLDFNGHGSSAFVRQPMLRYTAKLGAGGDLAIALENPASMSDGWINDPQAAPNIDKRPDLIVNWTKAFDRGFVSAQGLSTTYRYDDGAGLTDTRRGWGFGLGGAFSVTDADTLIAQYTTGKGLGRYLPTTSYHIASFDGADIRLYRSNSYVVGWTRAWSDRVRTNLAWGSTRIRDHHEAGDSKRMDEGFVNVIMGIAENTELGFEYSYGKRRTYSGLTGERRRIQTSLNFGF